MSIQDRLNELPVVTIGGETEEKQKLISSVEKIEEKIEEKQNNKNLKTKVVEEKSKYEIDKNTTFVIKFGIYFESNNNIIVIPHDRIEEIENNIKGVVIEKHWVKFRMWNFMESIDWRQECMDYNQSYRIFNVNQNKFNELKVRRLLLEWSFNEYDDRHKLFHINKQLTDESMGVIFNKLHPHIVKKIIELMNECLGD
jgi:hypothetical protein